MKKSLIRNGAVVVLAGSLLLGACSASDQKASSKSDSQEKTVKVLVHDSFNVPKELIADFEKKTGYTLVTNSAGDAGVVNQLVLQKDSPQYDAAYGVDGYSAYTALDAGVFADYKSKEVSEKSLEGKLSIVDKGDVCINVDHAWFKANNVAEPATIEDLAKPEYAKLLVVENPATSSTGLAFLIATIKDRGESAYTEYWKALLAGGAKVAGGWSDAYYTDFSGADGKGPFPLVVSYSASPAETKGATGSLDATCTRQYEMAGVLKGAKNEKGAKAFVDFMLSKEVQAALPENMYMYPVRSDVELPEQWAQYAKLTDNPIEMDLKSVAKNRETWIKDWTSIFEASK